MLINLEPNGGWYLPGFGHITLVGTKVIILLVIMYLAVGCGIKAPPRPSNQMEAICSKVR